MNNYPMPAYRFIVDWGGDNVSFTEVSGLDIFNDISGYRDGSSPEFNKSKMPGLRKYSNIILKRGIFSKNNNLYSWFNNIVENTGERRTVTISLLDETGEPVVVWVVTNAFPVRYSGPVLRACDTDIAYEELELAHEGLTVRNE